MLAVTWGLEYFRFWTLDCQDLHVFTDHKPLVGFLGTGTLDPILLYLMARLMRWINIIASPMTSTGTIVSAFCTIEEQEFPEELEGEVAK